MRLVALLAVLSLCLTAAFAEAAPPAAELESSVADSGGAIANPLRQGEGGGGVAPRPAPGEPERSEIGEAETVAGPGQNQPTTPEGEQQPDDDQPPADGDAPVDVEEEEESDAEIAPPVDPDTGEGDSEDGFASGLLPSTGLGLAALGAIGLGLLLAGLSFRRPRRSALSR